MKKCKTFLFLASFFCLGLSLNAQEKKIVIIHTSVDAHGETITNKEEKIVKANDKNQSITDTVVILNIEKGEIGAILDLRNQNGNGILISDLIKDGAAEKEGLQRNDLITGIDGKDIRRFHDFKMAMKGKLAGEKITVSYQRGVDNFQTILTLQKAEEDFDKRYAYKRQRILKQNIPTDPCQPFLGVMNSRRKGQPLKILKVYPQTPASDLGLQHGDRISHFDHTEVTSHEEIIQLRDQHQAGDKFAITIIRGDQTLEMEGQFKSCEMETKTTINNTLSLGEFKAFPNPAKDHINIAFEAEAKPIIIQISNLQGQVLKHISDDNFTGIFNEKIQLDNFVNGFYILDIHQDDKFFTEKIVVINEGL